MNEAIRRLEEKIAFLEHHVTEQDKVMLELTETLARLRREVKLLVGRLEGGGTGGASGGSEPSDERPPHY